MSKVLLSTPADTVAASKQAETGTDSTGTQTGSTSAGIQTGGSSAGTQTGKASTKAQSGTASTQAQATVASAQAEPTTAPAQAQTTAPEPARTTTPLARYRLGRAALDLQTFTASELANLTQVPINTVYSFVADLGPRVTWETLESDAPGRPKKLYSLTEEGMEYLLTQNLEVAKMLRSMAAQDRPEARVASREPVAAPAERPGLYRNLAPCLGSPFGVMPSFSEMDRLYEAFTGFGGGGASRSGLGRNLWYPQIEVSYRDEGLVVHADLPGIKKEDVQIEIQDNYLVLEGERRQEEEQRERGFYPSERSYGRFYRTIPLPAGSDPEQARANFRDGVLEVTIPVRRQQQQRGRGIEIY